MIAYALGLGTVPTIRLVAALLAWVNWPIGVTRLHHINPPRRIVRGGHRFDGERKGRDLLLVRLAGSWFLVTWWRDWMRPMVPTDHLVIHNTNVRKVAA